MNDDCICKKCGDHYSLRDGCDPTPFCDDCVHEEVERLTRLLKAARARIRECVPKEEVEKAYKEGYLAAFHKPRQAHHDEAEEAFDDSRARRVAEGTEP